MTISDVEILEMIRDCQSVEQNDGIRVRMLIDPARLIDLLEELLEFRRKEDEL